MPQGTNTPDMDIKELDKKDADELAKIGGALDVADADAMPREELVEQIMQRQSEQKGQRYAAGILDIVEDGYGFMRRRGLMPSPDDVYVSSSHVRRFSLRAGDRVAGIPRPPKKLSLIHISEPTRLVHSSRMPSSA